MSEELVRRIGVNRIPPFSQQERDLPENFSELLQRAIASGRAMVRELQKVTHKRQVGNIIAKYEMQFIHQVGVRRGTRFALVAVCMRSAVLVLEGSYRIEGIYWATVLSKSQHYLTMALLDLPTNGRLAVMQAFDKVPHHKRSWLKCYSGAVSEGKLIYALAELKKQQSAANDWLDTTFKVDVIGFRRRRPLLLFQAKSFREHKVIAQSSAPGREEFEYHGKTLFDEYLHPLWGLSIKFRRRFRVQCIPVVAFVYPGHHLSDPFKDFALEDSISRIYNETK